MILEKDSSVLGYPGETSKALDADHHNVCKYASPEDPNYIAVRNALTSLVSKVIVTDPIQKPLLSKRRTHDLESLLAITELPDADFIFFWDQWTQGTSEWLLNHAHYSEWLHSTDLTHNVLFLNGGPATGKSVLSSFIINSLASQGFSCQYFFIRYGDQRKRTLSFLLRSIAYQIASHIPEVSEQIIRLNDGAVNFETADARTIWERIFKLILFRIDRPRPLYWIIDGLDEANDPRAFLKLLSDISSSTLSIRLLLVGRKTSEIAVALDKLPKALRTCSIAREDDPEAIRSYIRQELRLTSASDLRQIIEQRVIEGAQNNFLVSFWNSYTKMQSD